MSVIIVDLAYFTYYVSVKPHIGKRKMRVEVFNETMIHISILHLMLFTDFVEDEILKFYIGYFLIGCLLIVLLINICFLLNMNFLKFKAKNIKKRKQKAYEARFY